MTSAMGDPRCVPRSALVPPPQMSALLKVKQEFAAKEKTQTAKKTLAKVQTKAVKKTKAA